MSAAGPHELIACKNIGDLRQMLRAGNQETDKFADYTDMSCLVDCPQQAFLWRWQNTRANLNILADYLSVADPGASLEEIEADLESLPLQLLEIYLWESDAHKQTIHLYFDSMNQASEQIKLRSGMRALRELRSHSVFLAGLPVGFRPSVQGVYQRRGTPLFSQQAGTITATYLEDADAVARVFSYLNTLERK